MDSKYNTGDSIDIYTLTPEERQIAFHEWAEGSPALENLLKEAYNKGFLSYACCGGDSGKPYIAFQLNDEYSRKMAMAIAKQLAKSNLDCRVIIANDFDISEEEYKNMRAHLIKTFPEDFHEENFSPTRTITELNVQPKMDNREEVFESILECIRNIKKDQLDNVKLPACKEELPSKDFKETRPGERRITPEEIGNATINVPTPKKDAAKRVESDNSINPNTMEGEKEIGDN